MRRTVIAGVILASLTLPAAPQGLAVEFRNTAKAPDVCARVYGFTGLFGQAGDFSRGVFTVLDRIKADYPCVRIYKRAWNEKVKTWATIKANYELRGEPIFLIGHSLGADATLAVARWLANDNIPVATVFSYDPTRTGPGCVPSNVKTFINWRGVLFLNLGKGNPQRCEGNRATAMQDYPLRVAHVLIDDLPTVHALTRKHVGEVLHMLEEMAGKSRKGATNQVEKIDMASGARRRSAGGHCHLTPRAGALWARIKAAFPDARAISCYRPGARMPSGRPSWHASANAIDWTTRNQAAGTAWSCANAPGMTIRYASGHIHSDVGNWKGCRR